MIRGRCPTCGKTFEVAQISDQPGFPFCSERCKLVDLGRWIDGKHVISTPLQSDSEDDPETVLPSDEDEE